MCSISKKLYEGPKGLAVFTHGAIISYKMIDPADPLSESGLPMGCLVVGCLDRIEGDEIVFTGLVWFDTPAERLARISHNFHTGEAEITEYL